MVFWEEDFLKHFLRKIDPFLPPRQPIKFTDLDKKSYENVEDKLNKHFL